MPSGVFAANAAWLAIAAMAHNLIRAAGALASLPFAKARAATIRRDLIAVAARTARHGRGQITPAPARRLALTRARMAQPPCRGMRAARRSGLTSPESVSTPTAATATLNPAPGPGTTDKPHNRRAAGLPRPDSPGKLIVQESGRKRSTGIGRWIEA